MSEEILKDLSRVIEKHKDKVFCTGELNYVDMAKSCELEIERLNNIINELDKVIIEFKKQIEEERKNYREIIGNFVDKLQELKGDGSNE